MSEKDYQEANAFVDWLVELINKIKEIFNALMAKFKTEEEPA